MAIKQDKADPKLVKEVMEKVVAEKSQGLKQLIYIGPNMLQLTAYTVIESDVPVHIQSLIEKCPSIEKLFVPIEKFTALEPKAKTKGTIEHRHFQNVLEYIAKKERE